MKKVIALLCATSLLLFAFVPFSVEASDNILRIVQGYTQSSIWIAYNDLTDDQKDICDYLVGCYNLTYLGARGFKFASGEVTDFNSFQVTVKRLGQRIMQYTDLTNWGTRMSDIFCQYVSSCIQYSQGISSNFSTWYSQLPSDFSIPYGKDNFDAWNNFYNDISNDGIATFQIETSEWSIEELDYPFVGVPFGSSSDSNTYNDFVLNNSPVGYGSYSSGASIYCNVYGLQNFTIDTLYLLRNSSNGSFRFGNYNGLSGSITIPVLNLERYYNQNSVHVTYIGRNYPNPGTYTFNPGIRNIGTNHSNYVNDAWYILNNISCLGSYLWNFYNFSNDLNSYVSHVVLVDDLDLLTNREEIFPTYGTQINSNDVQATIPKEDMLLYIKRLETDLPFPYPASEPVPIKNIVINNTYNYYGEAADPSTDFDNAVIDRTVQSYSEPFSVDEGIFTQASEYIMYLWENTKPLVLYTKDLLECFTITPTETDEETDGSTGLALAIYGSLAVGVAGGLISKLLL